MIDLERGEADDEARWPWLAGCVGWLAGGTLAALASGAVGAGPWGAIGLGALGSVAGGLAGVFSVGWNRRPGDRGPGLDLWDAWVDGHESEGRGQVRPARAPVRPRVFSRPGESFCLEDEIRPFAERGERGAIQVFGLPGSGKSMALRHLLAVLPPALGVRVVDEPDQATLAEESGLGVVVYTSASPPAGLKQLASFMLAPWGEDERIEYLLETAKGRCPSVMARLKAAGDGDLAQGSPELWRVVLDRMIDDESLGGVRQALRQELSSWSVDEAFRDRVRLHGLAMMDIPVASPPSLEERQGWRAAAPMLARLIRHRGVQVLIVADQVAEALADPDAPLAFLVSPWPVDLVAEAGSLIREAPASLARLADLVAKDHRSYSPTAASLLHASATGWMPAHGSSPRFSGAHLDRVDWPCIALPYLEMVGVGMVGARLARARLDSAKGTNARLIGANLSGASLEGATLLAANLSRADLRSIRADGAEFRQANLSGARLDGASLRKAQFHQANLSGARLDGADLTGAYLIDAIIDGADFAGSNLDSARLVGLTLSTANFAGARFAGAHLTQANLEGMKLARPDFQAARLNEALLTGSILPGANFRKADLRDAGLAEVEWEGACLVGADLRGASFHMGSSRSGLVDSLIASEGTRTGFYTDDFDEQDFKSPEEIRKADLRGVDLAGAKIDGVDFYLVDLRGAILEPAQADHVRRCGAILRDRSA